MSLQPGSNRLLPLGAVMRLHRWVGWPVITTGKPSVLPLPERDKSGLPH